MSWCFAQGKLNHGRHGMKGFWQERLLLCGQLAAKQRLVNTSFVLHLKELIFFNDSCFEDMNILVVLTIKYNTSDYFDGLYVMFINKNFKACVTIMSVKMS